MDNNQHKWAREELEKVYPSPEDPVRQAVTALLSVWTRVDIKLGDTALRKEAADAFARLAQMIPLDKRNTPEAARAWGPASQFGTAAQYARVNLGTIPEEQRWMYADRVGQINGLRRGVMTVTFLEPRDGAPAMFQATVQQFEVDVTHLMTDGS